MDPVRVPLDPAIWRAFARRAGERWGLKPDEARVLYLACTGRTSERDQARQLKLAAQTVKNSRLRACRKLGRRTLAAAVARAWGEYAAAERAVRARAILGDLAEVA